ncbi:hypothetical protein [Streptomyces sp. 8N706]|uniref:hypothetical protein n=1 Tax=Streptomyces sp. 8N706 TaxID=3457416 RepID=UPI003FCF3D69
MPGDRWEGAKKRFWAVFFLAFFWENLGGFDWLFEWERKKGKPLKGGWNSLAGQFAAALYPRSKTTGVVQVVQLTDQRLRITYVQRGRRRGDVGTSEPGWNADVQQVAWLRDRSDVSPGNHEIGFVDGSWVRVYFSEPGSGSFVGSVRGGLLPPNPFPGERVERTPAAPPAGDPGVCAG